MLTTKKALLRKKFEDNGTETYQSYGDADVLIVEKAIQKARDGDIVTIAADGTDILVLMLYHGRSSRPEVFCKKGILRNFAIFTEKHLCRRLFLIKLQVSSLQLY